MIITVKKDAPRGEVEHLLDQIESKGLLATMISGINYVAYGVVGDTTLLDVEKIAGLSFVEMYSASPLLTVRSAALCIRKTPLWISADKKSAPDKKSP